MIQLAAHLCDVISAVLAVDGFDRADVQTPEHLRAGVHPQLVPETKHHRHSMRGGGGVT